LPEARDLVPINAQGVEKLFKQQLRSGRPRGVPGGG
jgi:hypothetical protein